VTPENLKTLRDHYCLTIAQAARLARVPHKTWWRMERGLEPIPNSIKSPLAGAVREIERLIRHRTKFCQYCRKDVTKSKQTWATKGGKPHRHRCPYCDRLSTMTRKQLVAQAMPEREEVPTLDQRYRQTLDKLGYRRKNASRKKMA